MMIPTIFPVTCHTDQVGKGSTYVAIKGFSTDGLEYIEAAIAKGATTIVIAQDAILSDNLKMIIEYENITVHRVADTRLALAQLAAHAAGYPTRNLKIIGITGTKGKTTTSFFLRHLLKQAGYKTALLSTVKNSIGDVDFAPKLTTPQADYLHQFFKLCVEQGVTHVVMEVAAQAVTMHRVHGISFETVVFTNFSREHLEFYDSMESYFNAKKTLLSYVQSPSSLWLNADDQVLAGLLHEFPTAQTFSLAGPATITGSLGADGLSLEAFITIDGIKISFSCPTLFGSYNLYNVLVAVGIAYKMGISLDIIKQAAQTFQGVPGRCEKYELPNGATAFIDYAHNPSSFQALFLELRKHTNKLIVLFGAGGERDAGRRPQMGAIASMYADVVIITSDNPRSEDARTIMKDIAAGIQESESVQVIFELDRKKAIEIAYASSSAGAIITLLGKGPDEYQLISGVKYPFSERAILQSLR